MDMDPRRSFILFVDADGFVLGAYDWDGERCIIGEKSLEPAIENSVVCNDVPQGELSASNPESAVTYAAAKPCCRWRRDEDGYLVCIPC
jgi:hypothetical protein